MFSFFVLLLTGAGFVASAIFAVTWVPAAIKARRNGDPNATLVRLADYAALPVGIGALYALSLYNLITLGVVPAQTIGQIVSRILTLVIFDLIVGLRTARWLKTWSANHGAPVVEDRRGKAFSDHN